MANDPAAAEVLMPPRMRPLPRLVLAAVRHAGPVRQIDTLHTSHHFGQIDTSGHGLGSVPGLGWKPVLLKCGSY
jgi:hypothetical protein